MRDKGGGKFWGKHWRGASLTLEKTSVGVNRPWAQRDVTLIKGICSMTCAAYALEKSDSRKHTNYVVYFAMEKCHLLTLV